VQIFDDLFSWRCTPGKEITESSHMQVAGDQPLKVFPILEGFPFFWRAFVGILV
jgi:hypothetical protein